MPANIHGVFYLNHRTGSLYVEARHEQDVLNLKPLFRIGPGVDRRNTGDLVWVEKARRITVLEAADIRRLCAQQEHAPTIGGAALPAWVRIAKGSYRGDIGLLHDVDQQTCRIWVVPRTPHHPFDNADAYPGKRYPPRHYTPKTPADFGVVTTREGSRSIQLRYTPADNETATHVNFSFCGGYIDLSMNESDLQLVEQPNPKEVLFFKPKTAMKELFGEGSMDLTDEQQDACNRFSLISVTPWSLMQDIRPGNRVDVTADSSVPLQGTVVSVENDSAVIAIHSEDYIEGGNLHANLRNIRLRFVMGDIAEVPKSLQFTHDPQPWQEGIVLGVTEDELNIVLGKDSVVSVDISFHVTPY
jgi:hypothetical protein